MKRFFYKFKKEKKIKVIICLSIFYLKSDVAHASFATPFNGCTFYKSRLISESFSHGKPKSGCANFSAKYGRNNCKKKKNIAGITIRYKGDHVEMWLPDYFIEVTKHTGRSVFAESIDTPALSLQLKLAKNWWSYSTKSCFNSTLSNGTQSDESRESFWQARILTVPYGSLSNNFPPLAVAKGNGLPSCYSAVSEFMAGQWDYNLSDSPYAVALAQVGIPLCLTNLGATASGIASSVKAELDGFVGSLGNVVVGNPLQCANPVGVKEGVFKNALPTSDIFSPFTNDITKLCMGSWGNLIPRTGWIESEDPHMSAMIAAYKFMSLAGDFHLNPELKLQSTDKWQIVYPPMLSSKCFVPGGISDFSLQEDSNARITDELKLNSTLKNQTYIIAVWRKRDSCEEPLQIINGWNATHKANYYKNKAICHGLGTK